MTRTNARQLALQLSFAVSAGSDVGPDAFFDEDYFRALPAEDSLFTEIPGEEERAYINALVTGVRDHREELDDLIRAVLPRLEALAHFAYGSRRAARCAL